MRKTIIAGALVLSVLKATAAMAQTEISTFTANGSIELTFRLAAPDILNIRAVRVGHSIPESPVKIVRELPPVPTTFKVSKSDPDVTECGKFNLTIPKTSATESAGIIIRTREGKTLLGPGDFKFASEKMSAAFKISDTEQIFGGGLQFHSLAQRGTTKTLKVNADPRDDLGNSHAVTPFFLSTAGYGLFVNSTTYSHFDFGKGTANALSFHTEEPWLDVYIFAGPSFHDMLEQYTRLTGRMEMPPRWGLGFWYRMKSDWKADKATDVATRFRDHGIACDVLGLEPAWQTHAYSCSYIWNKAQFPDPAGYVKAMQDLHFHLNLWEHAYVHPTSPIHEQLKGKLAADHEVWGGLVPDFTIPETTKVFAALHQKEHLDLGVDGYKLDECDGSDFTGGWFFSDDTKFPSGMTGAQMHNVFGYLYQKRFHEIFNAQNKRSYLLCRANYAGGQANSTVVYSDWYDFKDYVRAACNSGFSGMLWCPEVRQTESTEEFVRRFQTLFFSPLAMINAWADGVTPWEKGEQVEAIFRKYDDLRSRLTPYLYNSFRNMNRTGLPVVRALVVDYPHDTVTYTIDDEFLYGDGLLVAPVFSGTSRSVYLPAGGWTDWWTRKRYAGGTHYIVDAPLDTLPIFIKDGSGIAMQPPMKYSGEVKNYPLEVHLDSTGVQSKTTLYDDDGLTLAYQKGHWLETDVSSIKGKAGEIKIQVGAPRGKGIVPSWTELILCIHGIDKQPTLMVDGKNIGASDLTGSLVHYDQSLQTLRVSVSPTHSHLVIIKP